MASSALGAAFKMADTLSFLSLSLYHVGREVALDVAMFQLQLSCWQHDEHCGPDALSRPDEAVRHKRVVDALVSDGAIEERFVSMGDDSSLRCRRTQTLDVLPMEFLTPVSTTSIKIVASLVVLKSLHHARACLLPSWLPRFARSASGRDARFVGELRPLHRVGVSLLPPLLLQLTLRVVRRFAGVFLKTLHRVCACVLPS